MCIRKPTAIINTNSKFQLLTLFFKDVLAETTAKRAEMDM